MIHLYVEHLTNIRTLSLQASLSTASNKETKATFSADGSLLILAHDNEFASVTLPINLSPNKRSNVELTIPAIPSKTLTFRISLEEKDRPNSNDLLQTAQDEDAIPWTAEALTPFTEVQCRNCHAPLIHRGQIQSWKDLPSEGWAEMMEFWHCHKPHEPHNHETDEKLNKGYAAGSQLALTSGVGMVDPLDFLLSSEDCSNIQVSTSPISPIQTESLFALFRSMQTNGPKRTDTPAP